MHDTDAIPSARDLSGEMQRKLLILASIMTLVIGLSFSAYFAAIGIWISAARGVMGILIGLGVLWFGLHTGRHRTALDILSVTLFVTFALATYLQDGVYSPALWWMITPPMISVLAGSLKLSSTLFILFLVHTVALYLHGPGSWGTVSLMAKDRQLQMAVTVVFSTIFMCIFVGMGRRWLHEVQRSLEVARVAAIDATAVKARFLSNMSHEIRTPLNGMIGATEMLRTQKMSSLQRRQLLTVQEQSAKMLMSLVNDILDFSKLEARKVQIEHTHTRLRSLVFNVNELFSVAAFERGIELTSSYDAAVPQTVLADSTRLRQILSNLVSNAVKFTHHGGVHIHLGFDDPPINAAVAPGVRWLRLAVSDTGPGIDPKIIPSLFNPFEQADGSVTRRYGGTGLGLSISHELATLMGGRIDVTSRLGVGSVFSVAVPLPVVETPKSTDSAVLPAGRSIVVTDCEGLWRHVSGLLTEMNVESVQSREMPTVDAAYRARAAYVVVDVKALGAEQSRMVTLLDELVDAGMRVAVATPLGGDALVHPYKRAALLYKPVRRGGIREFVFGDVEQNMRDSLERPRGIESAFGDEIEPPAEIAAMAATATAATATTESPLAPAILSEPRQMTVLVAEDNPINQIIARAMLADMNARVLTVANGREALDMLEKTAVDMVLMDVQMPELDGIAATRQLRARERALNLQPTPVIAITGNNETADRKACLEAGMNAFLSKPYRLEQLREAMAMSVLS